MLCHWLLIICHWLGNDYWSPPPSLWHKTVTRRIKKFTKALAPQIVTSAHTALPVRDLLQCILICPTYLLLFPSANDSDQNYIPCDIHIWYTLLFHLAFPLTMLEGVTIYITLVSLPLHITQLLHLVIIICPPKNLSPNFPTCDP